MAGSIVTQVANGLRDLEKRTEGAMASIKDTAHKGVGKINGLVTAAVPGRGTNLQADDFQAYIVMADIVMAHIVTAGPAAPIWRPTTSRRAVTM